MALRHVVSTQQFLSRDVLLALFKDADEMALREETGAHKPDCAGKILATVFYEPSTRTRFSFEVAMYKLGGSVVSSESAGQFSSAIKGETIQDTVKVIGRYADAIVLRHPQGGTAKLAAEASPVPVINAGDGIGEHPTQALLDLYTIRKERGRMDNLSVALVGDLLNGRTVHSLLYLLGVSTNVRLFLVSPPQLRVPDSYKEYLRERGIDHAEFTDPMEVAGQADVLYVTRIQKERFEVPEEYERLKGSYVIDGKILAAMGKEAIVMHPLPRVNEIAPAVDADPRAAYFRQAKNGVYIRMALLRNILCG